MDKSECRRQLGRDSDAFLILYVGRFSERKGAQRLNEALHKMTAATEAAFLGSGDIIPDFKGVVRAESVTHDQLPVWMNAADVLVLPTLAEGCCNAIAEAIACGLPIVSSNIEDVYWQVPSAGAILVDPHDTDALAVILDGLARNPDRLATMRSDLVAHSEKERNKNRSAEILL